jgi:hypothetical protein
MSKQLPAQPHLHHLRNQAKQLLRAYRSEDSDALARVHEHHPRAAEKGKLTLQEIQLVLAREYGFTSWPKLISAFAEGTAGVEPDTSSARG